MPDEDLSDILLDDYTALSAVYDSAHSSYEKTRHLRGHDTGQIGRFLWDLEPGNAVVTPMHPSERRVLVGVVSSGYYHEATADCPYPHRKKVEWLDKPVLRSSFSVPMQRILHVP